MHEIELNEYEQEIVRRVAKDRYETSRAMGIPDGKLGPQSHEFTDLNGMGAEMAYCKLMNIYPDLETGLSTPDFDCVTRLGAKIDVKATKYKTGHLLATLNKKGKPPDRYVLVIGEFPKYSIVGEVKADELLQEGNLKNFGWGMAYALTQDQLNPIKE